ncbi:probable inactive serine/threonine-protein kinase roco10 isoform X2 [Topomyia yanbarensis]|uniref:probable inactive serine/threonine-protein kinase roco10 isoform X2 n=1 Tax=Topomyia yanbarensis TaxID=2498891 RepID=UPI00273BA037|nr:probable inactive serine/threonine-protein kinase roco10 isoform X2 [Topomyia yanbarensis]
MKHYHSDATLRGAQFSNGKMSPLIILLSAVAATIMASPTSIDLSCSAHDPDHSCCIHSVVLDSKNSERYSFPQEAAIHLENCTIDNFSPELATRLSDATTELSILDGSCPKVYVKPGLKSFTSLRCGTVDVVIDPVENNELELLDLAGLLNDIPTNVQYFKKLAVLDLCENQIEHVRLDQLQGLHRLRKLNLGHNKIKSVSLSKELSLPALTELFLHGNELMELDLTHLEAPNLERLYVSENQLLRIDGFPQRFNKLIRTDLYSNKWNCSWLKETLPFLDGTKVETLSFLPAKVCDETGTVKVHAIECEGK